jgi:hypothetical protein
MPDKVADGVRFSCAWGTLHQHPTVFFKLLRDPDLFGIGRFAEQHFTTSTSDARWRICISSLGSRRFFSNDVQERPRQIFPCAEVGEDALDGGGEAQGPRTQKENRVPSNARVTRF